MTQPDASLPDDETLAFAARVFDLARHGDAAELGALLDGGLPPNLRNDKGDSLVMLAAKGDLAIARLLLEHGAKADGTGGDRTPLMVAAMFDKVEIATLLLEHGADPAARDKAGLGALDLARGMGAKAVPALLEGKTAPR